MRALVPKHPSCAGRDLDYLAAMDWQQASALGIVAVTAGLFIRHRFHRPKFSFERDTHCGCSAGPASGSKSSIVFRRRKGGPAEILVKMK